MKLIEPKKGDRRIKPFSAKGCRGTDKITLGQVVIPFQTFDGKTWVDEDDYDRII